MDPAGLAQERLQPRKESFRSGLTCCEARRAAYHAPAATATNEAAWVSRPTVDGPELLKSSRVAPKHLVWLLAPLRRAGTAIGATALAALL